MKPLLTRLEMTVILLRDQWERDLRPTLMSGLNALRAQLGSAQGMQRRSRLTIVNAIGEQSRQARSTPVGAAALGRASSFGQALGRQIEAARQVRQPSARVLRDSRGRRLRASAHGRRRGSTRHGGDVAGGGAGWMPAGVKVFLILALVFGGFLGSSQVFIDYAAQLPDAHQLTATPLPNDTMVYASDGSLLADLADPNRQYRGYYESLNQMGGRYGLLPEATVAIEDANFWGNVGVDPTGIARAAWADLQSGSAQQGASTLTQQLVKQRLLHDPSQSFSRKVKEAILAIQVDRTYPKSQILELYLNSVEYGNFAQGAQAAAQNYFRLNVNQLDLAQASMLAGLPQNPTLLSPVISPTRAKGRQQEVLAALVKTGKITQKQANQAYAEPLNYQTPPSSIKADLPFVNWVMTDLVNRYGTYTAYEGGLRVYTSINPTLQSAAQDTVTNNVMNNQRRGVPMHQGAMASIDPKTGEVLTMVGSVPGQPGDQYNFAATTGRSPGSTMKLFTYTAAIESLKFTMNTTIPDGTLTDNMEHPPYKPLNYNTSYHSPCPLQQCMGNSLNIPAVYIETSLTTPTVVEMAKRLGAPPAGTNGDISTPSDDSAYGASFTLGGYDETPLRMATAAATVGDSGIYHPPTGIARITASDGTEIYKYDPASVAKQAIDPKVAYIMQTIMSNNANRMAVFGGESVRLTLPGRLVGAKTGTSENNDDGWTLGYTPDIASVFWFGNPNPTPMGQDAIETASPAWNAFMQQAVNILHEPGSDWYTPPAGLIPAGDKLWLMPGTSMNQPTPPPGPGISVSSGSNPKPSPNPGSGNGNGNNGNGNGNGHGNGNNGIPPQGLQIPFPLPGFGNGRRGG